MNAPFSERRQALVKCGMASQVILIDTRNDQDRLFSPKIFTQNGQRACIGNTKRQFVDGVKRGSDNNESIAWRKGF